MKLSKIGISGKFIRILISLYSKAFMRFKSAHDISEGVNITEGVFQGEILSPLLFAIFLADLEVSLRSKGVRGVVLRGLLRILVLVYADDIVLLAESWADMELLLAFLKEFYELNQLDINK